ncbi:thermonuclease family protein [Methylotenera versatilis]|uniref:Nuclease (SNase domain protein) n=1 Tax=Methylotenera versatilis (strain 301) TaxID=666681 RepID=D7DL88_METV0|nr:thermonuclease family protein [Methylotenera versatilis]ADI30559.1 nuclease (SNase domain protein) [Methylotenera versatilis 301]
MIRNLLICLTVLYTTQVYADTLLGRVVGVADGDTITVLDASDTQHKIRLGGIDAPEKKQPFGQASKRSLSDLVYDKAVQVDWTKTDRYGRIVGKVLLNGLDANLEQVKRGLAWHYTKYQKEQPFEDRLIYLHAQEGAKAAKVGLWIEPSAVAPWDWRKQGKTLVNHTL